MGLSDNPDYVRYGGYGQAAVNYKSLDERVRLSLLVVKRGGWNLNANLRLEAGYRLSRRSNQYLFLQYYNLSLIHILKRRYGYAYDLHEVREVVFESLSDAPSERLTDDLLDADELAFQRLWKSYFDALAIPERFNPRLQRRQMPARFWKYLIEKE